MIALYYIYLRWILTEVTISPNDPQTLPKKDILAAIPGRLKNSLSHKQPSSPYTPKQKIKQLAMQQQQRAKSTTGALGRRGEHYQLSNPNTRSSSDEYSCTPVLDSAENIKKVLNVTSPAAVVTAGTDRSRLYTESTEMRDNGAQNMLVRSSSPPTLDIDDGQIQTQFHRIALHSDAKGVCETRHQPVCATSASMRGPGITSRRPGTYQTS